MSEPRGILRTALTLLPLQALLRGGEAVFPLLLAAWFGRSGETDVYYLLAAYFVFAGSVLTGAFQDSGVVPVLIEVEAKQPDRLIRLHMQRRNRHVGGGQEPGTHDYRTVASHRVQDEEVHDLVRAKRGREQQHR